MTQAASDERPETGADGEDHEEKRSRMDEVTTRSADSESKPVVAVLSEKASPPPRCNQCRQLLDDPDLQLFPGDHCDAVSCRVYVY